MDTAVIRGVAAAVLVAGAMALLQGSPGGHGPLPRGVPDLDPLRYTGTWFEVASTGPGRDCAMDVTATYGLRTDGRFEVTQRCIRYDGRLDVDQGVARRRAAGAWLEVNFLPAWLRGLRVGWDDEVIVAIDPDYRVAIVADPGGERLRILSRVPELDAERLVPMLTALRAQGYPVERLVRTPQPGARGLRTRLNVMT